MDTPPPNRAEWSIRRAARYGSEAVDVTVTYEDGDVTIQAGGDSVTLIGDTDGLQAGHAIVGALRLALGE